MANKNYNAQMSSIGSSLGNDSAKNIYYASLGTDVSSNPWHPCKKLGVAACAL